MRLLQHWQPHKRPRYGGPFDYLVDTFCRRATAAYLSTRQDERLTMPQTICGGALTGTLCTTLREVRALGREGRNCLARWNDSHTAVLRGDDQIWIPRNAQGIIAILRVKTRPTPMVIELLRPHNRFVVSGAGEDLIRWLTRAALQVGQNCRIPLADVVPP